RSGPPMPCHPPAAGVPSLFQAPSGRFFFCCDGARTRPAKASVPADTQRRQAMVNSSETRSRDGSGTQVRTTEARQATTGTGLRYMLGIGLALIVIAFAIIYFTMMR